MRRTIMWVVAALLLGLSSQAGGLAPGVPGAHAARDTTPRNRATAYVTRPAASTVLARFGGYWIGHSRSLYVDVRRRTVTLSMRAYVTCGRGVPPPCDTVRGNGIYDGIGVRMVITRVVTMTAYVRVVATTDRRDFPRNGTAALVLVPHGRMHMFVRGYHWNPITLCDDAYFVRHPSEGRWWDCGA